MNKVIKKTTMAALLAALSFLLSYAFDMFMPENFNVPFYAIPLILAGLMLGKTYGIMAAIVADIAIGLMSPYPFIPLFVVSKIAWALVPALFVKEPTGIKWYIVVMITYLTASLANTGAMLIYYPKFVVWSTFFLRLGLIIPFGAAIGYVTNVIFFRTSYLLTLE